MTNENAVHQMEHESRRGNELHPSIPKPFLEQMENGNRPPLHETAIVPYYQKHIRRDMKRKHEHKYLGIPSVNHYPRGNGDGELIYKGYVFPESVVNDKMVDSYKATNKRPTDDGFKCWAKRNAMYALHILETLMVSGAYVEYFL